MLEDLKKRKVETDASIKRKHILTSSQARYDSLHGNLLKILAYGRIAFLTLWKSMASREALYEDPGGLSKKLGRACNF